MRADLFLLRVTSAYQIVCRCDSRRRCCFKTTKKTTYVVDTPFGAIFFLGGHGTLGCFRPDAGVTTLVQTAFANNKFVASVCHGAAGLVTAKRADDESVVKDLRVSAFTDEEEKSRGSRSGCAFHAGDPP